MEEMEMRTCGIFLGLFMAATLLNGSEHAGAEERVGTGFIDYFGYSNCVKLENEHTRVILGPHSGGRVLEYSWKGENAIYLDPGQSGSIYTPGQANADPTGGRLDIGPETVIPKHPDLWFGKWTAEITGTRTARLTSVEDEATGTRLVREFQLDKSSSRLTCKQIIENVSNETKEWCHWSRTFAPGEGICIIPLTANSRFPNKYIMYGPGSVMNYRPEDPHIRVRNGFLEITGTPKYPKLGMDSYAGWFCYLMKNDLMFVKRFPTYPDRVYNEMAALTISIYYYKDTLCELEPIGPREKIAPGETASFTEEWWLIPHKFPAPGSEVDLDEVEQLVNRETR
jgi:hypothetical protein